MTDDLSEAVSLLRQILTKLNNISEQLVKLDRLDDIESAIQDLTEEIGDFEIVADDSEAP
jgi:hypothetical protein